MSGWESPRRGTAPGRPAPFTSSISHGLIARAPGEQVSSGIFSDMMSSMDDIGRLRKQLLELEAEMDETHRELGRALKKRREEVGLSVRAAARSANLDPAHLHRVEVGAKKISLVRLLPLIGVLA